MWLCLDFSFPDHLVRMHSLSSPQFSDPCFLLWEILAADATTQFHCVPPASQWQYLCCCCCCWCYIQLLAKNKLLGKLSERTKNLKKEVEQDRALWDLLSPNPPLDRNPCIIMQCILYYKIENGIITVPTPYSYHWSLPFFWLAYKKSEGIPVLVKVKQGDEPFKWFVKGKRPLLHGIYTTKKERKLFLRCNLFLNVPFLVGSSTSYPLWHVVKRLGGKLRRGADPSSRRRHQRWQETDRTTGIRADRGHMTALGHLLLPPADLTAGTHASNLSVKGS